jgi:uncharacterized protein (TIGR02246 family)
MSTLRSAAFVLALTQATALGSQLLPPKEAHTMSSTQEMAGRAPHTDDEAIRAIIADQAAAWNRHDAAAWASPFVPAAEFINILGTPFSGKPAIEGITTRIFATIFKSSHDSVAVQKIILVTPELAIAHYEHAVSGYTALPPGIQPSEAGADGKGVLRTRMVCAEKGNGWEVDDRERTEHRDSPGVQGSVSSRLWRCGGGSRAIDDRSPASFGGPDAYVALSRRRLAERRREWRESPCR